MSKLTFDFTPDPRVLIALTQTPLKPMDALCELIDNSIDSYNNSKLLGITIEHPTITINLPSVKDVERGIGVLRLRDNGPGMSTEQAERAIKAGYSGNNQLDTLGLFGMGFNISTGKLGISTRFTTARAEDAHCTRTEIDLEKINESKSYLLSAEQTDKPINFTSGTMLEISHWWPSGHPNHGFIKKLINYSNKKIREEIGRRYATLLRSGNLQIIVDNEACTPFEHCVWGSNRYVVHKGVQIPAKYEFNTVLCAKRRCAKCRAIIPDGASECPSCGSTEIRTVEERIKGWVGIQRYDDANKFGIDLIRNGRAIRVGEKSAFFEFVDDFGNTIKDYPIDGPYGRIIGEVNLDFVPVDFQKQDFQRSSEEWQRAITFLRGESSLQPNQPGASLNTSPIFKLFQGYRKVRVAGTTDMYMGYWDEAAGAPKRISRDVETEYLEKFNRREPGFYDDEEWWKLVEEASTPPTKPMLTCDVCGSQNLPDAEVCSVCGKIFKSKECLNPECKKEIPQSATTCPHCGTSQVVKVATPWTCQICGTKNPAGSTTCKSCKQEKGKANPLNEPELTANSNKVEDLSIKQLSVQLANGSFSNTIELTTYYAKSPLISPITSERYPVIYFKKPNNVTFFIDPTHPIFATCCTTPVEIVASELASYIFDMHRTLASNPGHTVSTLLWSLLRKYWLDKVEINSSVIETKATLFLDTLKARLADNVDSALSERLFGELSSEQQTLFVQQILKQNLQLSAVQSLKETGAFIKYVPNDFILNIFDAAPELFFNGKFWNQQYGVQIQGLSAMNLDDIYNNMLKTYRNSLESLIIYMDKKPQSSLELRKIDAVLNFLNNDLTSDLE